MKSRISSLNAVPHKRFFLSIIPDYDLTRSICELIDNAIDIWIKESKTKKLNISIEFDQFQKTILIKDNAGGVKEEELSFLLSPGASTNKTQDSTIGIFGVGTKRAVIALAEVVKIRTRYKKKQTFLIEFDQSWLADESWLLDYYEVDNIEENSTSIELQKLRVDISNEELYLLSKNLSKIYAKFLINSSVVIRVDGVPIAPFSFENWAYPPNYEPRKFVGRINTLEGGIVEIEVIAGLMQESSPTTGDYGVYFYCNDRLIVSALKTAEVGFIKRIAGLPDASLSIVRIIVSLKGTSKDMPWNSSKSNIDTNHYVFKSFRNWLFDILKNYCSLSRRLKGDWPESVFKFKKGSIQEITVNDFSATNKSYLIELPPVNIRYLEELKQKNSQLEKEKPWTRGLYEGIAAVDHIANQNLDTKNRISLILLDSNLEIAFKEYLVNDSGQYYSDKALLDLFSQRHLVEREVKKYIKDSKIKDTEWGKIKYYYGLRCKLVHERATVDITSEQLNDYRRLVEKFLKILFKLKF